MRQYIREAYPNTFWVEPAQGSTFGFADCVIPHEGRLILLELKLGEIRNDVLLFKVRPAQRVFARRMMEQGVMVHWAIGLRHERLGYILETCPEVLNGRVPRAMLPTPWHTLAEPKN